VVLPLVLDLLRGLQKNTFATDSPNDGLTIGKINQRRQFEQVAGDLQPEITKVALQKRTCTGNRCIYHIYIIMNVP